MLDEALVFARAGHRRRRHARSPPPSTLAVAEALAAGLIREPVVLPEGALQCHWRLQLTPGRRRPRPRADPDPDMPKRTDIHSIMIIGAGPIVIGQACEFDYSGAQACKALRAEGYRTILVNSNPATIMTDPGLADATYVEPITPEIVEKIIAREKPDALLPTMGGQTALNTAMKLAASGRAGEIRRRTDRREGRRHRPRRGPAEIPRRHGRNRHRKPEKRDRPQHGRSPRGAGGGGPARGHPAVFTLGGTGGGIAYNREEFERIVAGGLDASPTTEVLIEESVLGWKEYEMEVVRDQRGQLHHRLLDRERRSDGHPHRRFGHRGAGADADRQGIPAHARCLHRVPAQDRRRYRRLERAVRAQPGRRAHGDHRDEPARVAVLGAGLEGDRASRSPRSRRGWRWATRSTSWPTTSPAPRRPASSRPSTTWW